MFSCRNTGGLYPAKTVDLFHSLLGITAPVARAPLKGCLVFSEHVNIANTVKACQTRCVSTKFPHNLQHCCGGLAFSEGMAEGWGGLGQC